MKVRDTRREDLAVVGPLHARAFEGEIGPLVGPGYIEAFLEWFVGSPPAVSLIAEDAGQVVGYVFGAPNGYGPGLTRDLLPDIALGVLRNFPRILRHPSFRRQVRSRLANLVLRREPSSVFVDATPPGVFNLVGIGTAPSARGKGVGRALVEAFCERAAGRTVMLDVFKDNAAARSLYERCGFRELVEEGRVIRMLKTP